MSNEIGSEFWSVPTSDKENVLFPKSVQWFLSGRSALQAIIKKLHGCHTVSVPSWCCDSMVKPFVDVGMKVRFYPVYFQEGLVQEIYLDSDVLLIMDYFGYTSEIFDFGNYRGTVIRDVTHSIFSATYTDADYYFGSLRKWCGVWTGGYAWAEDQQWFVMEDDDDRGYISLRKHAMQLKRCYINRYPDRDGKRIEDKGYLKKFEAAEGCLEDIGIVPATERDVTLAHVLNVDFIKERRRANARVLMDAFFEHLIFPKMKDADCPLFVPILVPDGKRDDVRRYLINKQIYCPIHWPISKYHMFCGIDKRAGFIYENELSLVCDQRYKEEDMKRIIDAAKAVGF